MGFDSTSNRPKVARATAANLATSNTAFGVSREIDGMGHNIPPGLRERIADHIAAIVRKGEARAAGAAPG